MRRGRLPKVVMGVRFDEVGVVGAKNRKWESRQCCAGKIFCFCMHSNLQKAQYAVGGSRMEVNDGLLPLLGIEVANQQSVAFRSFLEVKHILK